MKFQKRRNDTGYVAGHLVFNKKKTRMKVIPLDDEVEEVLLSDFPKRLKEYPEQIPYTVKYNRRSSSVVSVHPFKGTFVCTFGGIASKEGEEPAPRSMVDGWGNSILGFYLLHHIQDKRYPMFEGTVLTQKSTYEYDAGGFGRDWDTGETVLYGNNANIRLLRSWLEASGVAEEELEFDDNLLPEIESIANQKGYFYKIHMDRGWIATIEEIPEWEQGEWMEEGETKPKKSKKNKKKSKKSDDEIPLEWD